MPAVRRGDGPFRQELSTLSLRLSGKISTDSIDFLFIYLPIYGIYLLALFLPHVLTWLFT